MSKAMIDSHHGAEMISSFRRRTGVPGSIAAFGAALAVAIGLFWAIMLAFPPVTEAADTPRGAISTTFDGAASCIAAFVCP